MNNLNDNYVIGFFDSKKSAEQAIDALKKWDKASESVALGQMVVLERDGDEVKADVDSKAAHGAKAGALAGVLLGVFSKKHSIISTAMLGALAGGAIGRFLKENLNMTDAEINELGRNIGANEAAVLVFCDVFEREDITAQFESLSGKTQQLALPAGAAEDAVDLIKLLG